MRKSTPPRLPWKGARCSLTGRRGAGGFTLVEILIVVAIIAVLASIAVPRYEAAVNTAKVIRTVCDLKTLSRAVEMYMLTNGKYPDSLADVGYGERTDPWGHKYQYVNIQSKILAGDPRWDANGNWVGSGGGGALPGIPPDEMVLTESALEAAAEKPIRKNGALFPLNSDFDLYSLGLDGLTCPKITAPSSLDDVIRANNGRFFGLAARY